jgi:hypothetical protein
MSFKPIRFYGLIILMTILTSTAFADSYQWEPVVLDFTASKSMTWYNFPLRVTFTHPDSKTQITIDGYWDGDNSWKVRFAPFKSGIWNWKTSSSDSELNNKTGSFNAKSPTHSDKNNNPNLHGHLKISGDHRRLEYADGTPFLWIGDTNWAINADRCGLNNKNFYVYVNNRKDKKFNLIQIQFFGRNNYNEGGYPFPDNKGENPGNGDWHPINPKYFKYVDTRMDYLFDQGFVVAGHPSWLSEAKITLTWAKRIVRYLMARYGAYNTVWSLTGEYQFSRKDSDSLSSPNEWNQLGNYVQSINQYHHPITIHPTYGAPSYISGKTFKDYSSSGEFHNSSWLDINWIQTYAYVEDVSESVYVDYNKTPTKPVIMAEPAYEFYPSSSIDKQVYNKIDGNLSRLQAWSAILCGAAGHTYGAWGVWQFYTPSHPQPGYSGKNSAAWSTRLDAEGASDMQYLKAFFLSSEFDWTTLVPHRDWLRINGSKPTWPSRNDFTPPHLAAEDGKTYVVYVPSGNNGKTIAITKLDRNPYQARWFDPRNGKYTTIDNGPDGVDQWTLPSLPNNNDWVLLLTAKEYSLPATPTGFKVTVVK